ncbi:SET domain-containing protein [Lactarius deliciosus]|nr:SET domain-containing protein [Lactarius deliciosus]
MASTPSEPPNSRLFKEWFASHGGHFHSNARYAPVPAGLSIIASEAIELDATIVTCPFSIIITPLLSKGALLPLLEDATFLEHWSERQLIIIYICFHWIARIDISHETLIHSPYLGTLPSPDRLRTPLHFSTEELDVLKGTNLYGATIDRRRAWEAEWEQCLADVSTVNAVWGKGLTWEHYLTASTYLSSRAFPSTLLSTSPSLFQNPDSYPVLIPGVDSLNHARAQPVSWVVSHTPSAAESQGTISLVARTAVDGGAEIFNNYGAKPNSELLLGYGFTLPDNPDDTIVLKIGGGAGDDATRHEVGRGARGADSVWGAIVGALKAQEDGDAPEWQTVLDAADMLRSMTEALLARLPNVPVSGALRADIADMICHYVSGQHEVLQDLVEYANKREMDGVAIARREGVVVQLEGGDVSVSHPPFCEGPGGMSGDPGEAGE